MVDITIRSVIEMLLKKFVEEIEKIARLGEYTVEIGLPDGYINVIKNANFDKSEINKIEEMLRDYECCRIFVRKDGVNEFIVAQFWRKDLEAD